MLKTAFIMCLSILWCLPAFADGVADALSEPRVVPIVRGPLTAPMVITEQQVSTGYCTNSQNPGTPPIAGGYEVRLACDHIVVGVGLLGGLYLLGSAAATN